MNTGHMIIYILCSNNNMHMLVIPLLASILIYFYFLKDFMSLFVGTETMDVHLCLHCHKDSHKFPVVRLTGTNV